LTLAGLTALSSLTFWTLRKTDGESISKGVPTASKAEPVA
jgi:hypothetical protein